MSVLNDCIKCIERVDLKLRDKTQAHLNNLTKPIGSLGKLEDLAKQLVDITQQIIPPTKRKVIFTFAGDHGVVAQGVSPCPQEVTPQMVTNMLAGGAAVNVFARHVGAKVVIADLGVAVDLEPAEGLIIKKVAYGTNDISKGPAMTREQAIVAIENGMSIFNEEYKKGIDIVGTGEMGIGNTTPSSAIVAALTGSDVATVTGRGTGLDDAGLAHKVEIIKKAIEVNKPDATDALDVLAKVGGYEIAGLVGVILAAALKRVPVVIDGFISTAAAMVAYGLAPNVKDYLISAHKSVEQGHKIMLEHLGLDPLIDYNLRLGEGTGAALAMNTIDVSIKMLTEMATFDSAGVNEKGSK